MILHDTTPSYLLGLPYIHLRDHFLYMPKSYKSKNRRRALAV